ncbi:MAG TPA: hypothetical protein VGN86_00060 [Pyrinomonadaceae bacterium]|jgi:hypothetical protein|nr:hypothetical protein [Pyrinomonadaceae bacterium]
MLGEEYTAVDWNSKPWDYKYAQARNTLEFQMCQKVATPESQFPVDRLARGLVRLTIAITPVEADKSAG